MLRFRGLIENFMVADVDQPYHSLLFVRRSLLLYTARKCRNERQVPDRIVINKSSKLKLKKYLSIQSGGALNVYRKFGGQRVDVKYVRSQIKIMETHAPWL